MSEKEDKYLNDIVSEIQKFVEKERKNVKPKKDGTKILALWLWGCSFIKPLMEKEPWNAEKIAISQPESDQLYNERLSKIVEKLKGLKYNAYLDFEESKGKAKTVPVDLQFLL